MPMNTTSLVNLTAEETGLTKPQTEATLKAALKIICGSVASGQPVRLPEFGTFQASWRSAYLFVGVGGSYKTHTIISDLMWDTWTPPS